MDPGMKPDVSPPEGVAQFAAFKKQTSGPVIAVALGLVCTQRLTQRSFILKTVG